MTTPSGDAGIPNPPAGDPTFTDVTPENEWARCYKHVEYLAGQGIVNGYWNAYRPDQGIICDQMAVYVARALRLPA